MQTNGHDALEALLQQALALANAGHLDQALALCMQALQSSPADDRPSRLALQILLRQKRSAEAKKLLQQLVQGHATAWRCGALLDLMRSSGEKPDLVLRLADQALSLFPDVYDLRLSCGAAFQSYDKEDKAIALYETCRQEKPDDVGVCNNLAELYRQRGEHDAAIALWESVQHVETPHARTLRQNLAQAYLSRGDKQQAETLFRALLALYPHSAEALRGLAEILTDAGDCAAALPLAQEALQLAPSQARCWALLARITELLGDTPQAVRILQQGAKEAQAPLPLRQRLFAHWLQQEEILLAEIHAQRWMDQEPNRAEYPLMLAQLAYRRNNFDAAHQRYQLAEQKDWKEGGLALVRFYEERERLDLALAQAQKMVRRDESISLHHGLLAEVCYSAGHYDDALAAVDNGLKHDPYAYTLVSQKVRMLCARERYVEAQEAASALLRHRPLPRHHRLLLDVWEQAGTYTEAVRHSAALHTAEANNILYALWYMRALAKDRQLDTALTVCAALLEKEPGNHEVASRHIDLLLRLERYEEAYAAAQARIPLAGERPNTLLELAIVLRDMGKAQDAVALLQKGMASFPHNVALRQLLADMWRRLDKPEEERQVVLAVMESFPPQQVLHWCVQRLVRIVTQLTGKVPHLEHEDMQAVLHKVRQWGSQCPQSLEPYWLQYEIADKLNQSSNKLAALDAIEARCPDHVPALICRANTHSDMKSLTTAIALRRKVCALRPNSVGATQALLDELVKAGDFDEFEVLIERIRHLLGDKQYAYYRNLFFNLNAHPTLRPEEIFYFFDQWYKKAVRPALPPRKPLHCDADPHRKLRVAYISPDFHRHSMAYYMEPLFMHHDRQQFELFAYAHIEPGLADAYTEKFQSFVHHWIDITAMSTDELEKSIRENHIDILIDMAGHTAHNRLEVFLRKPAPVQMGWSYAYLQTAGLPEIEYMVCDALEIPPEHEPYMAEKHMARFSFAGHPYKAPDDAPEPEPLPLETNGYVTFGVTTRPQRVNTFCIEAWARILHGVPEAKLCFSNRPYVEEEIQNRIIGLFANLGIGRERLLFTHISPYWGAYSSVDVQLDTFPSAALTTLSEGLWMERIYIAKKDRPPMCTCSHGMLSSLDLQEYCAATTVEEYIEKSVFLGKNPQIIRQLSYGLRRKFQQSKLMDYQGFGKEIAALYRNIWRDFCHTLSTRRGEQ